MDSDSQALNQVGHSVPVLSYHLRTTKHSTFCVGHLIISVKMAMSKTQTEKIQMTGYTVDCGRILGRGSFGIVHSARGPDGFQVAAKCIDGKDHQFLSKITHLEKLVQIDHPNVVNVKRVYLQENMIWMFMEFCDSGDLNKYFTTTKPRDLDTLSVMLDIARGVQYLHSQNIIHRDLKPGNTLISTGRAKLADFDLSKFLEDCKTSVMTSDVGTKAFKAPEFWMRTSEGKLNYHRNIDIYSVGLTFLAMIQFDQKVIREANQKLVPRIETPREDSEMYQDIGALISERVRYNVQPLEVISEEKIETARPLVRVLRQLIQAMTKVKPEEKIKAAEVAQKLQKMHAAQKDLESAERDFASLLAETEEHILALSLSCAQKVTR